MASPRLPALARPVVPVRHPIQVRPVAVQPAAPPARATRLAPPPLPPVRPVPAASRMPQAPVQPVQAKRAAVVPAPLPSRAAGPQSAAVAQPFLAEFVGTTLAIGLTALYQNYNREPEVFENRQADHWQDEHNTMTQSGLVRHRAGTQGFNNQITSKRPFIWVLDAQDRLYVMDGLTGDPKHSMAAKGRRIYSGGVGQWLDLDDGRGEVLTISNVTGHYHASYESQYRAAEAFRRAGHPVKIVQDRKGSAPRGYLWQTGRLLGLV
jgi:hypothetical protein